MATSFPIETQERYYWCWAAITASILRYFYPAEALKQCRIASKVTGHDVCSNTANDRATLETAFAAISTVLRKPLALKVLATPPEFKTVQREIDAGRPVCARISWFDDSGSHFVIISGYSLTASGEAWVDISDPYYEDSTVPYEQLKDNYLGIGSWNDAYLVSAS